MIILTFRSRPLTRVGVGSATGAAGAPAPAEAFLAAARMGGARTSSGDGTGCCDASTDFRPAEAAAADTGTAAGAAAGEGAATATGAAAGIAGAATIGGGAGSWNDIRALELKRGFSSSVCHPACNRSACEFTQPHIESTVTHRIE